MQGPPVWTCHCVQLSSAATRAVPPLLLPPLSPRRRRGMMRHDVTVLCRPQVPYRANIDEPRSQLHRREGAWVAAVVLASEPPLARLASRLMFGGSCCYGGESPNIALFGSKEGNGRAPPQWQITSQR
jgi:hypothetical protein